MRAAQESALRDCIERQAVLDVVVRYASAVDARDWMLFRSCFCDELAIDFSSFRGAPVNGMPADAWVRGVRSGISGFDATQHLSSNHRVKISRERAHCSSAMRAQHSFEGHLGTLGGHYENDLRRTDGQCRIYAFRP